MKAYCDGSQTRIAYWFENGVHGTITLVEKTTHTNHAEYAALIYLLKLASKLDITDLDVYSDSELMVRQLVGYDEDGQHKCYHIKDPTIKRQAEIVSAYAANLQRFTLAHVGREENPAGKLLEV